MFYSSSLRSFEWHRIFGKVTLFHRSPYIICSDPKYFTLDWILEKETEVLFGSRNHFHHLLKSRKNFHFCLSAVTIDCNYENKYSSTIKSVSDIYLLDTLYAMWCHSRSGIISPITKYKRQPQVSLIKRYSVGVFYSV